jgi:ATP-binding cassette subfamily F protein 3
MIDFLAVSKNFGGQDVLRQASLRIHPGERVGVVGPNGAGKTTLFSLITGEMTPDSGTVALPKNARLGYLRQQLRLEEAMRTLIEHAEQGVPEVLAIHDRIVAIENGLRQVATPEERNRLLRELGELQTQYEHMHGYDIQARAKAALGGLGFQTDAFERPLREFSGGWQMRAELARVLVPKPHILLLDEPSNYLDIPAIEWLQRHLRDFPGTLVMISHDRYLLNTLTNVTVEVAGGRVTRYAGNYDAYVEQREVRIEREDAAWKNQERKREQVERFIERFRAKNTKSSQVQSRVKMLEKLDAIEVTQRPMTRGAIRLKPPPHAGQEILRLEDAGITYDGQRWVLRNVDLRIERGDKLALVGLNGLGKTTLLRAMGGSLPLSEGRRVLGHKVQLGYQSQDFGETMDPRMSVFDTVRSKTSVMSDQEVRTLLGGFGFPGEYIDKRVDVLSGGEKVRLAFAKLFASPPNFLLLDEPTTHLDIAAREMLEDALRDYQGTVCLVSHDITFITRVAAGIIAMTPPGITRYHGGYEYYRQKMAEAEAAAGASAGAGNRQSSERKVAKRERAEYIQQYSRMRQQARNRLRQAERTVEKLEAEQKTLVTQLEADGKPPPNYSAINRRLSEIQDALQTATAEWETAALEAENVEKEYREGAQGD